MGTVSPPRKYVLPLKPHKRVRNAHMNAVTMRLWCEFRDGEGFPCGMKEETCVLPSTSLLCRGLRSSLFHQKEGVYSDLSRHAAPRADSQNWRPFSRKRRPRRKTCIHCVTGLVCDPLPLPSSPRHVFFASALFVGILSYPCPSVVL